MTHQLGMQAVVAGACGAWTSVAMGARRDGKQGERAWCVALHLEQGRGDVVVGLSQGRKHQGRGFGVSRATMAGIVVERDDGGKHASTLEWRKQLVDIEVKRWACPRLAIIGTLGAQALREFVVMIGHELLHADIDLTVLDSSNNCVLHSAL